jgi:MacB-like periplasmic core domain
MLTGGEIWPVGQNCQRNCILRGSCATFSRGAARIVHQKPSIIEDAGPGGLVQGDEEGPIGKIRIRLADMPDVLLQDVRYGLRTLAKSPAFIILAVVSLALGLGANISICGFMNAALFKPVAVELHGELVSLYHRNEKGAKEFFASSYPEYEFYRNQNTVFSGMLAYLRVPMILRKGGAAQQISGELVSPDYFTVLGIRPAAGRFFRETEPDSVTVISYALWHDQFGRNRGAIGSIIHIGSGRFTVIGVAPPSFYGIVIGLG